MKKEFIIYLVVTLIILCVSFVKSDFDTTSFSWKDDPVSLIIDKDIDGYKLREFDVSIGAKKHRVTFAPSVEQAGKTFYLYIDNVKVKEAFIPTDFDYFEKNSDYILDVKDFYFIKGADFKTYLGIHFVNMLIIFNEDGKVLNHKPFLEELDYFNYTVDVSCQDDCERLDLKSEKKEDIKKNYFYKTDKDFVSTKIENNKIYSFILSPDINEEPIIYDYYPTWMYLYENEYVISEDEIYYKPLNKYKVYLYSEDF